MPNELKPCPFCGQTNLEVCTSPTNSKKKYIRCRNDLCHYGAYTQKIDREMGWNRRPIEDALQARIEELEAEVDKMVKHNRDNFSEGIKNACDNSLILKKYINKCNLLSRDKAKLEAQIANLRANSRTKLELDTCRSLNESLRDENVRLIAKIKKLEERFGCAKQKN